MLGDARFFGQAGPFTLAEIAAATGAAIPAGTDPARRFLRAAPLDAATADSVSFLESARYAAALGASRAGACLMREADAAKAPAGMIVLACAQPYLAWARALGLFHPAAPAAGTIDQAARIDPTARLGGDVTVRAGAVIGARALVGAGSVIGENAVVCEGVVLGEGCVIGALASVSHAILGDRVAIGPGARIGHAGFGFAPGPAGFVSVPQLGRVLIGDDADIGANTTIDRGSGQDTVIGAGCRIDNLVQIGHNVRLGRHCVIVSQVGISGSTIVGDRAMLGGQAGLTGHLKVGTGARIGAQAGVMGDVPAGADVIGSPAQPVRDAWRAIAALNRLAKPAGRGVAGQDKGSR
ncbi:UDP-3-O-(3-hydroxymyristoyl)glucosamine N-acyltransferase [Elioraea sp.]|uniref:UDP-3-O-(3-hydroxymyristoyl)glucosamine N-acyltransferase n=1 Tax=Elioraea sp. TaxID=2185103 RepID=UPI0025C4F438|nr:UDP-3-O-(3-hydroxymyristoyl)glucosamine N-acyltransferase [Elioraea sp.]